jgi:predicted O-linked N-acetylglucosamine transferase (SPINDLY family)
MKKKSKNMLLKQHHDSASVNAGSLVRTIAFYLPQFHPIPENDAWWGKGFTEWTNVTRAEPMFEGHHQPHRPADLGYYDLRIPEIMEQQAELARQYGVHGFCYYYYWFAGRRLLEKPLERMLESGSPDFPFCLCWANENWSRRWDGSEQEVLMKQEYGPDYARRIIRDMLPFLQDKRYISVDGKPLLLVYRVDIIPECAEMTAIWREEAEAAGLPGLYLVRVESFVDIDPRPFGFDAACEFPPHLLNTVAVADRRKLGGLNAEFEGHIFDYSKVAENYGEKPQPEYKRFKGLVPAWDNTARKKLKSVIIANSTPEAYRAWLGRCLRETLKRFKGDERLVFINAWNEWAEGCHLEPDQRNGHAYLEATRSELAAVSAEIQALQNASRLGKMEFAVTLFNNGQYTEAYETFIGLIDGKDKNPLALVYLGLIALLNALPDEAHNFFTHAIETSADRANTMAAIGQRCMEAGALDFAELYFSEAIVTQPRLVGAYALLADVLEQQGHAADALKLLAATTRPEVRDAPDVLARLIRLARNYCDSEAEYHACLRASAFPDCHARAIELLGYVDDTDTAQLHEQSGRFVARFLKPDARSLPPGPRQRLRIGFVVGKLNGRDVANRVEALLRALDPLRFETLIFARDASVGEEVQRLFLLADKWVPASGLGLQQSDQLVRSLEVDVLINLDGFAHLASLELFNQRSAPLQLSWPTPHMASALPCVDNALHTRTALPPESGKRADFIVTLDTPVAYIFPQLMPRLPISPHPLFTFGCLLPPEQISARTWDVWVRILQASPKARLLLNVGDLSTEARAHIVARFDSAGVTGRIVWTLVVDTRSTSEAWRDVDTGLCPLGADSTHMALLAAWCGVPSIAPDYGAPWSRNAADSLRTLRLDSLIAHSDEAYIALACRAAQDAAWLSDLSHNLHQRTAVSPANDAAGFAAAFGEVLLDLWQRKGGTLGALQ